MESLRGRHRLDRLDDPTRDQVRIGGRVWTTIFEVALVAVVDEAVRDPDRGSAVRETVAELVDRLSLMQAGETKVILWTINRDVLVHVLIEGSHE